MAAECQGGRVTGEEVLFVWLLRLWDAVMAARSEINVGNQRANFLVPDSRGLGEDVIYLRNDRKHSFTTF
jgi:hypothetical protein